MKKVAILFIILILLAVLLVSCECNHENVTSATCTAPATCKDCGEAISRDTGHVEIVDAAKSPTCTESGLTEGKHCSVCNEILVKQESVAALGHTEVVNEAKAPTCTEAGLTEGKHCSVCNEILVKQESVAALGHTEVVDTGKAPTCTEAGLTEGKHCSVCNDILVKQEPVAALGHTEVVDTGKAPTCTEAGLSDGKHCSVCNKVLVKQETVAALGHTEVIDAPKAPTCTKTGLTEGKHCSTCKKVFVKQETIAALGHTEGKWIVDVAPTTSQNGSRHQICSVCSATIKTEIMYAGSIGLTFTVNSDGTCTVTGIGTCKDKTVYIPEYNAGYKVTAIGNAAFKGCTALEKVVIPSSVTKIGSNAFDGCTSLSSVNIPNGVVEISAYVFNGCTNLSGISIPSGITSIGTGAFNGCSKLMVLSLPATVKSIGANAFSGCEKLVNATILEGVTSIGTAAFSNCSAITKVNLPSSVKMLDASVFDGCTKLDRVTVGEETKVTGNHTFTVYIKSSTSIPPDPSDPLIEYIDMYYDDRTPLNKLIGASATSVSIRNQIVVSKSVESSGGDVSVIKYDKENKRIIASGVGTAVIVANGKEYNVRVKPAPITLVLRTGHSMGYGSKGDAAESVLCEAGQAYNTSITLKASTWRNSIKGSALGYTASDRVVNIDGITSDAGSVKGAKGVNSALAYEWNRLTGEKMWVVNVAVGGSSSDQWQPGHSKGYGDDALSALKIATGILKNEVSAGHYEYRTTVIINFSSANFSYNKVEYDDEKLTTWQDGMWDLFVNGVTDDIDGDGSIDKPTMIGYVPAWSEGAEKYTFTTDKPLIYYRSAIKDYSHVFLAADTHRTWGTNEGIVKNFPKLTYETQNGVKLKHPTTTADLFADTSSHYYQVGYNAQGFEMARALYEQIHGTLKLDGLKLYEIIENNSPVEITTSVIKMTNGDRRKFVAIPDPFYVNDLEITVTGNLKLEEIFYVTATSKGEGTITIKHNGKVVRAITVIIE